MGNMTVILKNTSLKNTELRSWKPSDTLGNRLWLDGSDSSTITLNGSTVSQWDDKSGNNYHVSQSTASYQLAYETNVQNGLSALRGNGTSTWMERDGLTDLGSNENFTLFVVGKSLDHTSRDTLFGTSRIAAGRAVFKHTEILNWSSTLHGVFRSDGGVGGAVGLHTPNFVNNLILTTTGNSTVINTWANGSPALVNEPNVRFNGIQDNIQVGARVRDAASAINPVQWLDGYIYEIIYYNRELTDVERQLVEAYLSTKWSIT